MNAALKFNFQDGRDVQFVCMNARSVRILENTTAAGTAQHERKSCALALLGAISLIGLATGCASIQGAPGSSAVADKGSFKYNSDFDYRYAGAVN
jgi:hypothetical protein